MEIEPSGRSFVGNPAAVGGSKGTAYEWHLAGYSLLAWPKTKGVVNIATNVHGMGNLDDIVFSDENNIITCVQAKHGIADGNITLVQLLGSKKKTHDGKSSNPILLNCFNSFEKLLEDVRYRGVERVILFAVRDVNPRLVEAHYITPYKLPVGESFPLLNFTMRGNGPASYKLNLEKLKGTIEWENNGWENIGDEKLRNFFSKFILCVNQPNVDSIGKEIQQEIEKLYKFPKYTWSISNSVLLFAQSMNNWHLGTERKQSLTNKDITRWIDQYMKYMKFEEDISQYTRFDFQRELIINFKNKISGNVNFVKSTKGTVLPTALVIRCMFEEGEDYTVFSAKIWGTKLTETHEKVVGDISELMKTKTVIIVCDDTDDLSQTKVTIKRILTNPRSIESGKKVVLISSDPSAFFSSNESTSHEAPVFTSQKFLYETLVEHFYDRKIVFQPAVSTNYKGQIGFKEFMELQCDHIKIVDFFTEDLFHFFAENDKISIGQHRPEEINYYISRELVSIDSQEISLSEEQFVKEKGVYAIYSDAGGGKSSLLSHLFKVKHEKDKKCWPIRLDLNTFEQKWDELKKYFTDTDTRERDILENVMGFNIVEKALLRVHINVTLILDSFDEIGDVQKKMVISWVNKLQEMKNKEGEKSINQIWIGSRRQAQPFLTEIKDVKEMEIGIFSDDNQKQYLTKVLENTKLENILKEEVFKKDTKFWKIPLHCQMATEYIKDNSNMCITDFSEHFYDNFLKRKVQIYMFTTDKEKKNYEIRTDKERQLLETFQRDAYIYYSRVAAKQCFRSIPTLCSTLDRLLEADKMFHGIGLTDQCDKFSHRNYAEYFLSIFISRQFCYINEVILYADIEKFNNFFWNKILIDPSYCGVRNFLDKHLKVEDDKLKYDSWEARLQEFFKFTADSGFDGDSGDLVITAFVDASVEHNECLIHFLSLYMEQKNMIDGSFINRMFSYTAEISSNSDYDDSTSERILNGIFYLVQKFQVKDLFMGKDNPIYVAVEKGATQCLGPLMVIAKEYKQVANYDEFIGKSYGRKKNLLYHSIECVPKNGTKAVTKLMDFSLKNKVKLEILLSLCEVDDPSDPLTLAIYQEQKHELNIVQAFLDGLKPLIDGKMRVGDLLFSLGFTFPLQKDNPLIVAVKNTDVQSVTHIKNFVLHLRNIYTADENLLCESVFGQDADMNTAIHWAAGRGNLQVLEELKNLLSFFKSKTIVNKKNNKSKEAYDLAKDERVRKIITEMTDEQNIEPTPKKGKFD